jgi:hypothetical protein
VEKSGEGNGVLLVELGILIGSGSELPEKVAKSFMEQIKKAKINAQ